MSATVAPRAMTTVGSAYSYWDCFTDDYVAARERFTTAAQAIDARVTRYAHPLASGPHGETLSIDVAQLGAPAAPRMLVVISGTHGLEGSAGSALQIGWLLSSAARELPADVGLLMIHALNPYGFAHQTRTNENNVDLNRNFIGFDGALPVNEHYGALDPWLIPPEWDRASLAAGTVALARFRDLHGDDVLFDTVARGQYTHPQGMMFGSTRREWSNLTLETIVQRHLGAAECVGLIDWHTGIGEYGAPFFLCFNHDDSPERELARAWWGRERVEGQRPHGLARPQYQGLVFDGLRQFLAGRRLIGAVVELGTRGRDVDMALRVDPWLRFRQPHALRQDPIRDRILRADMVDTMVPVSRIWRESVLAHGLEITRQALAGLASTQLPR